MRAKRPDEAVWDSRLRSAKGSLFERLQCDEEDIEIPREAEPLGSKIQSIKRNLARVLNARAGAAAACPDLGLVDFNISNIAVNDLAQYIIGSIQQCITEYEPRVQVKTIEFVQDPDRPLNLLFKITTEIASKNKDEQVQINILMENGGAAKVM